MLRPKSLLLIALAIGIFYTFTRPQYDQVNKLRAVAAEYDNVLDNISRIAETRDRLLINYEEIPNLQKERLYKVLPDNIDSVRLALDLDGIASRYGISIKDIQVETEPEDGASLIVLPEYGIPYEKARVSFSFISNYQNFMRLLSDLEKSLRIMDVKSASFRASDSGLYEHQLTLETYWLKK